MQLWPLCTDLTLVKARNGISEAKPLRCRRWSCPTCAENNRRRVIAIAMQAKPKAFLTLTVSSTQYPDADDAADALKNGLRLLRLRLKRHTRLENFQFLAVFERHKSGHPHLHLMVKGSFLPWKLLRKWWEEITGSTHVHIRKIDTRGKAAFYVAKYIGKDLAPFAHCKRWWRSHGYSEGVEDDWQPDHSMGQPVRYRSQVARIRFAALALGFQVEDLKPEGIRWRAPPGNPLPTSAAIAVAANAASPNAVRIDRAW